jgi:hypothetical protein
VSHFPDVVALSDAEYAAQRNLVALHEPLPYFDFSPFKLPWYDELEYEEARKWKMWQEGRDALGQTCHYIAELEALSRWLWATHSMARNVKWHEPPCPAQFWEFIGTWAVTIQSCDKWMKLHRGHIPIYVISVLPEDHPIVTSGLSTGCFDGGERYRRNCFDQLHEKPNTFTSFPTFSIRKNGGC